MKRKIYFYFIFVLFVIGILSVQNIHSKSVSDEEQLILVGIGAFKDGFYDIAEKQFSQFIKEYPNHERIYDVGYLLGKTLLFRGKMKEAKLVFLKILNEAKYFENLDYTYFWVAGIEMKLGNGEEAKKHLFSLLKKFPKFIWIDYSYFLLGLIEFGSNKLSHAESFFKEVSLLSKNNDLIRVSFFWLGILSFKKNHYETATGYFQKIWEDPKFIPQGYLKYTSFWLGEAQLKLGKFNDAKKNYKIFFERFKNDFFIPEVHWRLGFCEYRLGNIKASIEILQSFKNNFKEQLILYTHYLLGEIFSINDDYPSSIKELNLLLNRSQGNILWGASFLHLFWNYVHLGEMEEAKRIFQRLQKLNHFEDEKIFIQLLNAEILFSEGSISDSLPFYFNIINTRFREKALFQIGKGYFFENKFREAIPNVDILILEFPNSKYMDESLFIKGECFIKLGNLERALETFEMIIKQNRNSLWQIFALAQSGDIYFFWNEDDKAENAFKEIINLFSNHPLFYHAAFQMGNLNFKKKNIGEAVHYYSMVLRGNIFELFGEAYFRLGEIFYQQEKYEKALKNFEKAIQYLKENSLGFFLTQLEIGNLQRKWGQYEEAKKSYRIIIDHSKDEEIKKAAKELLIRLESR